MSVVLRPVTLIPLVAALGGPVKVVTVEDVVSSTIAV